MSRRRILLFLGVFVLFNFGANFAHPVTPTFIVERQLDSSMFGTAMAAMLAMNFFFSPLWGRLCSYVPTRRIQMITTLGYAAGQVLFLLARSEAMVVAARFFAGAFTGGCFTAFTNYIINVSADSAQRDRNLVILVTVQSVSSACGYFLGGMLGVISTNTALIAQILTLALAGLLFPLVCVDDSGLHQRPAAPLQLRDANPFGAFAAVSRCMTGMLALLFAVAAVSSVGQNAYEQCFNYYIKDQYGMTSAYNGTFKAVIALLTLVLNSTAAVWLQKKTDIHRSFLWILVVCSGLVGTVLLFDSRWLFIGIYILYSSVNVIRLPLVQSMIAQRSTPESRSSLMGFNQSMNSLGGIFGALFAGLIYKRSPMLPFRLAFAAYTAAALIGLVYVRRYRREGRS